MYNHKRMNCRMSYPLNKQVPPHLSKHMFLVVLTIDLVMLTMIANSNYLHAQGQTTAEKLNKSEAGWIEVLLLDDETDEPAQNIEVRFFIQNPLNRTDSEVMKVRTGQEGVASINIDRQCKISLSLEESEYSKVPFEEKTIPLAYPNRKISKTIQLKRPKTVEGYVVDFIDQPVENATVGITFYHYSKSGLILNRMEKTVETDSTGRFTLEAIAEGSVDIAAVKDGYAMVALKRVETGAKDIKLMLQPGRVIEGIVIDEDNLPVNGARIHLIDSTPHDYIEDKATWRIGNSTVWIPEQTECIVIEWSTPQSHENEFIQHIYSSGQSSWSTDEIKDCV